MAVSGVRHAALDIGHDREGRIHQHDAGHHGGIEMIVDLRRDSASYGKWFGTELSAENGLIMWIPPGFAHGFCVLGYEPTDVVYKVDVSYNPKNEVGIHYADSDLNIKWPISKPIVSARDEGLSSFKEFAKINVF